jgi:hypothetical protein
MTSSRHSPADLWIQLHDHIVPVSPVPILGAPPRRRPGR